MLSCVGERGRAPRDKIIAKLPHDMVARRLPIQNPHERGPGGLLAKQHVSLLAYRTPKLVFCELL
jgi:hypothetical protein